MKHPAIGATFRCACVQGFYWMTYCVLLSFSSPYLLGQGFSNTEIGLLLGMAGLAAAVFQPLAGGWIDRSEHRSSGGFATLLALAMVPGAGLLLLWPGKGAQAGIFAALLILLHLLAPSPMPWPWSG